jgi:hypothetical protein
VETLKGSQTDTTVTIVFNADGSLNEFDGVAADGTVETVDKGFDQFDQDVTNGVNNLSADIVSDQQSVNTWQQVVEGYNEEIADAMQDIGTQEPGTNEYQQDMQAIAGASEGLAIAQPILNSYQSSLSAAQTNLDNLNKLFTYVINGGK